MKLPTALNANAVAAAIAPARSACERLPPDKPVTKVAPTAAAANGPMKGVKAIVVAI